MKKVNLLYIIIALATITMNGCCNKAPQPEPSVSCRNFGLNAFCSITNPEKSKSEICWDVHFKCRNKSIISGHACEKVDPGATMSRNIVTDDMNSGYCDTIESVKVDDLTSRSLEKSMWDKIKKFEFPFQLKGIVK